MISTEELPTQLTAVVVSVLTLPDTLITILQLPAHAKLGLVIVLPLPKTLTTIVQLSFPVIEPPDQTLLAPESNMISYELPSDE